MFERCDQDTMAVFNTALAEARRLGHNYVGTEHVLLALLDDDGTAGTALREAGVEKPATEAWIVRELLAMTGGGGA